MSDTEPLFSVGSTDPEALYDFAVLVSAAEGICIDSDSELFRMYRALVNSAWGQLPEVVTIVFASLPGLLSFPNRAAYARRRGRHGRQFWRRRSLPCRLLYLVVVGVSRRLSGLLSGSMACWGAPGSEWSVRLLYAGLHCRFADWSVRCWGVPIRT